LADPATAPFQNAARAGVMPSMRAVSWLSTPQHRQAAATSAAAARPGQPALPDTRAPAAVMPATASQPRAPSGSRNHHAPSAAVAATSRLRSSETELASARRRP
jgi:hypothetical protein